MSQETPNADRLLLYGKDAGLLETRAMVLRSAGLPIDITIDFDDLAVRIAAPSSIYWLLICCHTATERECDEVVAIANRNSTTLMMLEPLLLPSELIHQVSILLDERRSGLDNARPGGSR